MISLKQLLNLWGFTEHPFEAYTAEKEARLTDYFVAPPYLDDVLGTATSCAPVVVFGSRGIGKSAIRIHIENLCLSGNTQEATGGTVVAVTHDDFAATLREGLGGATLERHLETLVQKMVFVALIRVARALRGDALTIESVRGRFPDLDLETFARLVAEYFINLSELQREAAFRGIYDFFREINVSQVDRLNWLMRLWATLRVPLIDIANLIQAVRGKSPIEPVPGGEKGSDRTARTAQRVIADFESIAAMGPQLGIDAWYVLVDKVDEHENTDSDAGKACQLIIPLLKTLRIIETPRVGFKFFLWDRLRPILVEQHVRFDKIKNLEMSWTEDELREMIDRRLGAYSNGTVRSLNELADTGTDRIYTAIFRYATGSPREIVQIIDAIFREHARHSDEGGALLTEDSIERGIDEYCVRRVRDLYLPEAVRAICSLPSTTFTSSQVQSTFRISQPAASNRIRHWEDNGYVRRIEDARSTRDPSKSVYQYEVSEPRLRRILEKDLMRE